MCWLTRCTYDRVFICAICCFEYAYTNFHYFESEITAINFMQTLKITASNESECGGADVIGVSVCVKSTILHLW